MVSEQVSALHFECGDEVLPSWRGHIQWFLDSALGSPADHRDQQQSPRASLYPLACHPQFPLWNCFTQSLSHMVKLNVIYLFKCFHCKCVQIHTSDVFTLSNHRLGKVSWEWFLSLLACQYSFLSHAHTEKHCATACCVCASVHSKLDSKRCDPQWVSHILDMLYWYHETGSLIQLFLLIPHRPLPSEPLPQQRNMWDQWDLQGRHLHRLRLQVPTRIQWSSLPTQ